MAKFIFITGGVVSSLGKGICAASIAALLQARGFKVRIRKLDPYLNVDPGTMSPTQHGEVFVTEDGAETDLDLGHYERFTDFNAKKLDNITAGQVYSKLLNKERKGDYLGGTVQVIPHVTNLIKEFIYSDITDEDFIIYEIGGTVGDIEGLPFLEAIRQTANELDKIKTLFIHVTLIPYIRSAKELKTKPTQHSVKELRSIGIQPNILICRSESSLTESEKNKISLFCNIAVDDVIEALDASSIYNVPLNLYKQDLDQRILNHFNVAIKKPDLKKWRDLNDMINGENKTIKIAIVGKYTGLEESYKSLIEAINHASFNQKIKTEIIWVNARKKESELKTLQTVQAILVPGGFGNAGLQGKIDAIEFARENNIPFLGICLGMQAAILEFSKNKANITDPYSSEFDIPDNPEANQLIGLMTEWQQDGKLQKRSANDNLGGTMRLGAYPTKIAANSKAYEIYGSKTISERHRHRYEVNEKYVETLEQNGLKFSGKSPDQGLAEIIEIENHPFFIAVQFHPEFKSRPFKPHPLFSAFIKAASKTI